ncbi:MAG: HEAT repeat domain-containing protein [Pyrinomonadaceae bacterium]
MVIRFTIIFFLLCFFGFSAFSQESRQKSVEQLIKELKGDNRNLSDAAIDELASRKDEFLTVLTSLAQQTDETSIVRARAIITLSKIRNKKSVPFLIKLLDDRESYVRGTSAYALSQIGGERAKTALVAFLKRCWEKDRENLSRAAEAIKELPDARAFPTLMKIVNAAIQHKSVGDTFLNREPPDGIYISLRYEVQALGEIGDPRASEPIARLLDSTISYQDSIDYLYLEAIYKTKGKDAVPYLLSYLESLVKKMKGQEKPENDSGAANRQILQNFWSYEQTIKCLEAITGQHSLGDTREDVLKFWQQFWKSKRIKSEQ